MKRTLLAFALVGGVGVPAAFVLLRWLLPDAGAALNGVQWPLWPMSRMFADDRAGRHWLYLPLAAVLSNALIYAAIGALAAWGRTSVPAFVAALVLAVALPTAAQQAFDTGAAGLAAAIALAVIGLALHRWSGRRSRRRPS
jgi:hypothetical protein